MSRALKDIATRDIPAVRPASAFGHAVSAPEWSYAALIGRFVELSSGEAPAGMTAAVGLVHEAQEQGEPVAWITTEQSAFFPPDVAAHGVDLAALAVVRVADGQQIARSADMLLRSGSFGLVVLDLGNRADMPMPLQARLMKLAQYRNSVVLCLTIKPPDRQSLSSLVSLRGEARRITKDGGRFVCEVKILKDKHRAANWLHTEECNGPVGLC